MDIPLNSNKNDGSSSILILYPWGIDTVLRKNIGAGLRVGLLADFLRDHGYRVTVLSIGRRERILEVGNIFYREKLFPTTLPRFLIYASVVFISRLLCWPALRALLYYFSVWLDKKFSQQLRSFADSHSVVLLEYPFWFDALGDSATKTILTNHDVLALSWTKSGFLKLNRKLFSSLLRRELKAMNGVAHSIVVAPNDAEYFLQHGVKKLSVITNPVVLPDTTVCNCDGENEQYLFEKYGAIKFNIAAIFVGSGWYPNRTAAKVIVENIAPLCPEIAFFIVGDCCASVSSTASNVFLLGSVTSEVLEDIYNLSTFALIPVTWGTGTSLKALESMARGKVIVSTRVGVRGLPFEHGVHGIVIDDTSEYASVLTKLQQDFDRCKRLTENAKKMASQYDYRTIYKPYLELIDAINLRS